MRRKSHSEVEGSGGDVPVQIETDIEIEKKIETKEEVIALFGGRAKDAAEALGITESAFSRWRDPLSEKYIDRAWGAAFRRGKLGLVRAVVRVEFGAIPRKG